MFGIKFIKVQPTIYLLQYRRGQVVREGLGLAFFYYAPTTSLVAIPVGSTDVPFIFEEPTADYQTVTLLPNFVFGPEDIVVALGQDGLVANTLKYLNGQPLVGVNPDPRRYDGQLLPFRISHLRRVMPEVFARRRAVR